MASQHSAAAARRRPAADWVHQFLIVLPSTDPLVWRRIQVPKSSSFWDLHVAIQDAMGWLDCHLHEFRVVLDTKSGRIGRFGIPVDDMLEQPPVQADWTVKVSDVVGRGDLPILYTYDFGDDWRHIVMYEGGAQLDRRVRYPRCVSGARRCPPEDCGGVHGYAEFLEAIRDPKHERHAELLDWIGGPFDPDDFDATTIAFDDPKRRWKTAFESSRE
jgi:Plasmid pRiA4b ORF-3-like protein